MTTYVILQDMVRKGVLNEIKHKGAKLFSVVEPDQLVAQRKVRCQTFEQSLPEFAALADVWGNKPRIQYFEGSWWIERMYEDMLTSTTDILAFVWLDQMDPELSEKLFKNHVRKRVELGILAKVIVPSSEKNSAYKAQDEEQLRQTLIIDNPLFTVGNEIDMYWPNKVSIAMYSWDEMSWTIIHSKKLYDTLSGIFNLLWSQNYSEHNA